MKTLVLLVFGFCTVPLVQSSDSNWPSFRGEQASGVASGPAVPTSWDIAQGKNLRWKTPVPGLGHSSPILWGKKIFLTTATRDSGTAELKVGLYGDIGSVKEAMPHRWELLCLDRDDGRVLWRKVAHEGIPRVKRHPKASHANSTPATDGRRVVCFFGSEGLFCYDLDGTELWKKDLGILDSGFFMVPSAQWGFASSPIIHDGKVIIQCDVQTNSFLAAFDINDGREIWRTVRTDVPTWSTPTVLARGEQTQIIVNGFRHAGGYDFRSGKEVWKLSGNGDIPVPTPVIAHDLIFLTSAHGPMSPVYAIRTHARGDISLKESGRTNEFIAWSVNRGGNYMQTPIVVGEFLFCCKDNGVVTCYRAATGQMLFSERLGSGGSGFTASPVASHDKLYYTSELGQVFVLAAGPAFSVVNTNELGETCMATPAIADGNLFFRTRNHLIAIGERR
jgi:outer membrane protein assembly factor BamB